MGEEGSGFGCDADTSDPKYFGRSHTQLGQITRNGKENGQSGWEQYLSAPLSPADLEEMDRCRVKMNGIGEYKKER